MSSPSSANDLLIWIYFPLNFDNKGLHTNASFVIGMSEFRDGEVSLICRKIILIHGQGPGFGYSEDKRFK